MLHGGLHGWLRETEDCPPHLRVRRRVVQRSEQMLAVVVLVSRIDHGLVEQWVQLDTRSCRRSVSRSSLAQFSD